TSDDELARTPITAFRPSPRTTRRRSRTEGDRRRPRRHRPVHVPEVSLPVHPGLGPPESTPTTYRRVRATDARRIRECGGWGGVPVAVSTAGVNALRDGRRPAMRSG